MSSNGTSAAPGKILVYGAGSVGCYVGGRLQVAGASVTFVGRRRLADEIATEGMYLTGIDGAWDYIGPEKVDFRTDLDGVGPVDLVLVCVKSGATADAAAVLAPTLAPDTPVISLQNGLGNVAELRARLPQAVVLPGMVMFNVVVRGPGWWHQGTSGSIDVAAHPALDGCHELFEHSGLRWQQQSDIESIQWAKLLLNLNNPVNALSGLPLLEELRIRDFRRCLALAQAEALDAMDRAGIAPAKLTAVPPRLMCRALALPNAVFTRIARSIVNVDPLARSSMLDDLDAGRRTEIDWLSGEIVRLAERHGGAAPVNARLVELVRAAENGGRRDWPAGELLAALRAARAG